MRHCVFVLGAAGSSKSQIWQCLATTQTALGLGGGKTACASLNPKAVSSNELYGYINPTTKELNDGVIAKIMRTTGGTRASPSLPDAHSQLCSARSLPSPLERRALESLRGQATLPRARRRATSG